MSEEFKLGFDLADPDKMGSIITLIKGESQDGKKRWAYLSIKLEMYLAYTQALERENVDITKFGEILSSGEGEEPSDEIKKEMKEKHGTDEDFENILVKLFADILNGD